MRQIPQHFSIPRIDRVEHLFVSFRHALTAFWHERTVYVCTVWHCSVPVAHFVMSRKMKTKNFPSQPNRRRAAGKRAYFHSENHKQKFPHFPRQHGNVHRTRRTWACPRWGRLAPLLEADLRVEQFNEGNLALEQWSTGRTSRKLTGAKSATFSRTFCHSNCYQSKLCQKIQVLECLRKGAESGVGKVLAFGVSRAVSFIISRESGQGPSNWIETHFCEFCAVQSRVRTSQMSWWESRLLVNVATIPLCPAATR